MRKATIVIGVVILCLPLGTLLVVESRRKSEFCSTNHTAYKALEANYKDWLEHFVQGGEGFSISNSDDYFRPWVSFKPSLEGTTNILVVQVDEGTGYRPGQGEKGYFYSPTGAVPDLFYLNGKTEFMPLGAGIFCYKIER